MANKNYIVLTPLRRPAKKGEEPSVTPEGATVSMSEDEAAPLVACGAIRISDANDAAS